MSYRNRGKNTGDDALFGPEKQQDRLRSAVQDMQYLLSREYAEKASSQLVGNHYRLKTRQIQAVRSASASSLQAGNRKLKEVQYGDLENKTIHLDGFNVLILLESLLSGAYIFEGTDGCFRDLSAVHRTYKRVNQTRQSIELVAGFFRKSLAKQLIWVFDQPVSNSGRIRQMILDFATEQHLHWKVELELNPDKYLAEHSEIAVTSDAWILDHCKNWFNLAGHFITAENLPVNLVKMS